MVWDNKMALVSTRKRADGLLPGKRRPALWLMILCLSILAAILFCNHSRVSAELSHEGLPKVSFEVKDTPLRVLIDDYLGSTGYAVKGCEKWDDIRVTLKVQGAHLDEALGFILKSAGITSYVMKIEEAEKQITLRKLDKSVPTSTRFEDRAEGGLLSKEERSVFLPPPDVMDAQVPVDPENSLDMEVTPPIEPGGKGLTLRELQGEPAGAQAYPGMEVTPPIEPGGKGLTLRELNGLSE